MIQWTITLVTSTGFSFRAVGKIFIHLNLYLRLNLEIPAHTTDLNQVTYCISDTGNNLNRFMNLTPLFKWGIKMIHLLDNNELRAGEKQSLSFLEPLREFAHDTCKILIRL